MGAHELVAGGHGLRLGASRVPSSQTHLLRMHAMPCHASVCVMFTSHVHHGRLTCCDCSDARYRAAML